MNPPNTPTAIESSTTMMTRASVDGNRRDIDLPPFLIPHRDAKVVIGPALGEHVPGHIALVQALHDKDDGIPPRVDVPRAELLAQPKELRLPNRIRLLAVGLVRIIEDPVVAALPHDRAAHGLGDPIPGLVVLEVRLDVLVGRELEDMAPPRLIPRRIYHAPGSKAIPGAKFLLVGREKEPGRWPVRPFPGGPSDAHRHAFGAPRWDVDHHALELESADCLEHLADGPDMPVVVERAAGFDHLPHAFEEGMQVTPEEFGFHECALSLKLSDEPVHRAASWAP